VFGVARMFPEELIVMPHDEDYKRSNMFAAYQSSLEVVSADRTTK
jgi:hypothetical protein